MITPLVEMLEVPNFGHMTTSRIQFGSHDNILTSEIRHQPLKHLYFKQARPRVANLADIIKIATIFVKITFKDEKE